MGYQNPILQGSVRKGIFKFIKSKAQEALYVICGPVLRTEARSAEQNY